MLSGKWKILARVLPRPPPEPLPVQQRDSHNRHPVRRPLPEAHRGRCHDKQRGLDTAMLQLMKSMVSLPWAVTVYGAQQFVNLLSPDGVHKAEGAFYSATVAAQSQFASNPIFFAGFQVGDQIQQAGIDLFFDTLELQVLRPEWIRRTSNQIATQSATTLRTLTPGENLNSYI